MDSLIDILSVAGLPTGIISVLFYIFFIAQKQLATVRAELIATIERQKIDIKELSEVIDKLNDVVDKLQTEKGNLVVKESGYLSQITQLNARISMLEAQLGVAGISPGKED